MSSRDAESQAKKTYNTASNLEGQYSSNANSLFSKLAPQYQQMATNPQGFTDKQLTDMNTSVMQSAGGSAAGLAGRAARAAASTGNSGAYQSAISDANRQAMKTGADAALNIQNRNAELQQQQQNTGLAGMSGLYGTNVNGTNASLGAENSATNALTSASENPWWQTLMQSAGTLGGGYLAGRGK